MVQEKVWQDQFQIKTTFDARTIIKTTLDARYSRWSQLCFLHGDNIVLGEDQEDVPDLINDDIGNNPSVPQGIAVLAESICHVG